MSKSPINFGMMSGVGGLMGGMMSSQYGNMSDEQLRSQYDAMSRIGGAPGSFFGSQRNAVLQEIQRRQALGDFGMPQATASVVGAAGLDPNNSSAKSSDPLCH